MSEEETKQEQTTVEEPKITVTPPKKEKNPKRVAQGKRLAQISKQAKEKKLREKIKQESRMDFSVNYNTLLYFGAPAIVFAGFYLYAKNTRVVQVHYSPAKKKKSPHRKLKMEKKRLPVRLVSNAVRKLNSCKECGEPTSRCREEKSKQTNPHRA